MLNICSDCYTILMKYALFLLIFPLFGFLEPALSQAVFKCSDASGVLVFSDSPCAADSEEIYVEDTQSGISSSNFEKTDYQPGFEYSEFPQKPRLESVRSSSSITEGKKAISFLKSEAREKCGDEYRGKSESDLLRSLDIIKTQSKTENTQNERAEIHCHLGYLEKIKRIEFGGLDYALEYDLREASGKSERVSTSHNQFNDSTKRQPNLLIDPFSGRTMPRTGAGYTDPVDGTFYHDTGSGVVNTKTGEFIPTNP